MKSIIVSDRCIELSRDKNGFMDIVSANILCNLVMVTGSSILNDFENKHITGKEIRLLYLECGSDMHKFADTIKNGFPLELLARVKDSDHYLDTKTKRPKGILRFLRR